MKRNEVRQTEARMKEGVRLGRRESEYCICHTAAGGRERGEKGRICQSLYHSLHVMCLSCDDLCSYVPYWSSLIVFFALSLTVSVSLPETLPQGPPSFRWRLQTQMIPPMGTARGWCTHLFRGSRTSQWMLRQVSFSFPRNCFVIKTAAVSPCSPRLVTHWS